MSNYSGFVKKVSGVSFCDQLFHLSKSNILHFVEEIPLCNLHPLADSNIYTALLMLTNSSIEVTAGFKLS